MNIETINEFITLLQTTSLESMETSEDLDSFLKKLDIFEESLTATEFEEIMVLLDEENEWVENGDRVSGEFLERVMNTTFGCDRDTLEDRSWLDDYLNEGLTWG